MQTRSRIVVVHSDPAWNADLGTELGGAIETVPVASAAEALRKIAMHKVDLVVAEEKVGVEFLEELSRKAPGTQRAILLNGGDRRPWIDAVAEGHLFTALPEHAPDLVPRLRALVAQEAESPRALSTCTVELRAAGGATALSGPLLRLTSDALTVRIEPGDSLEHFLPGQELDEVVVRRGAAVVVEGCAAAVQGLVPDSTGGYELTMVLTSPRSLRSSRDEHVVRDVFQRSSLIVEAIRRGRLAMERADGHRAQSPVRGRVDPLSDVLILEGVPDGFGPATAVRFSFEAGGVHYRFDSALSEQNGSDGVHVCALLPPELRGRRRSRPRVSFSAGEVQLEVTPMLAPEAVRRPVLDIDVEGMGFAAEPGDLLPLGLRLNTLRVRLPDGSVLNASGRIVSRSALQAGSGPRSVRCGVQLDPLAPGDEAALGGVILRRTHAGLELARGLTFDALWSLLRECGFLYPEKEERLHPSLDAIRSTMTRLLERPHGPLRVLVFRQGPGALLQGHVSAVHAYRRTWMVQHLSARKDGPGTLAAAKALNAGVMEYLEQLPDADWVRIWFRPKNRWPARTFGRFARLRFDPSLCDIRTYSYLVAPTAGASGLDVPGLDVSFASAADWSEIRRCFVARGEHALLAAENLTRAPDLSEMDDVYREFGLTRRREALVARRGGRLLGFALLEITSPGVNLSELTSAFRLETLVPDPDVVTALASRARLRYAEVGQHLAVGLALSVDERAWSAAGFVKKKEYACLTAHRSLWRRYVEFVQRLYEHVPCRGVRPRR